MTKTYQQDIKLKIGIIHPQTLWFEDVYGTAVVPKPSCTLQQPKQYK